MSTTLDNLRQILEHSYNSYSFQARCRAHSIIVEKTTAGSIVVYRADDRDDRSVVDTSVEPFDKILKFYPG